MSLFWQSCWMTQAYVLTACEPLWHQIHTLLLLESCESQEQHGSPCVSNLCRLLTKSSPPLALCHHQDCIRRLGQSIASRFCFHFSLISVCVSVPRAFQCILLTLHLVVIVTVSLIHWKMPRWRQHRRFAAKQHRYFLRWPVSTTFLVDEHSVTLWHSSTNANRLMVQPVKLSTVGSRAFAVAAPLHISGIHCQLTSLLQAHCPPSVDC